MESGVEAGEVVTEGAAAGEVLEVAVMGAEAAVTGVG